MVYVIAVSLTLALFAFSAVAWEYRHTLRTTRPGPYELTCPRDGSKAEVEVDPKRAARTAAIGIPYHIRLSKCSHWPERSGCDQHCIKQIASGHMYVTAEPKATT